MDAAWRAPIATDTCAGLERRLAGHVLSMVSRYERRSACGTESGLKVAGPRFVPLSYMLLPIPRCSDCVHIGSIPQPYQSSLKGRSGRPAHYPFRGLLGIHSRCGLHTRAATNSWHSLPEGFSHIVTSMTAPVATGWSRGQVGLTPTGKRRLFTAHTRYGHRPSSQKAVINLY